MKKRKRENKKAIAGIITVIILILLALAIILILYDVIKKHTISSMELTEAQTKLLSQQIDISKISGNLEDPTKINITLYQPAGRIVLKNITLINYTMDADIFSVVDLSQSMYDSCKDFTSFQCCMQQPNPSAGCIREDRCLLCNGIFLQKVTAAKNANKIFIDNVLSSSKNRLGLITYQSYVIEENFYMLSQDKDILKQETDSWQATGGGTCICCGINKAVNELKISGSDKLKTIVLMSDGDPQTTCTREQSLENSILDAVDSAKTAYDNGIIVYTLGFGTDVKNETMQQIADAGHGQYYYANVSQLQDAYTKIAQRIKENYGLAEQYDHLAVVIYNQTTSYKIIVPSSMLPAPLETKTIEIPLDQGELNAHVTNIQKIEIYLFLITESNQKVGRLLDTWEIK